MKGSLITYWHQLNEREHLVLAAGAIITVFYLFYLIIYSPLSHAVRHKTGLLAEKQETLVWIEEARKSYKKQKPRESLASSQLLTVLADHLNTTSFKQFPYQLQQTATSDIQLNFDKVPYNAFMTWFWSMNQKYALNMKQFNVFKSDVPGIVKLTMIISTH